MYTRSGADNAADGTKEEDAADPDPPPKKAKKKGKKAAAVPVSELHQPPAPGGQTSTQYHYRSTATEAEQQLAII